MKIGGFQKFSMIEYPGKISAVVFTQGCNFRCPYCHNPELVKGNEVEYTSESILEFLHKREGLLDAVTISGGEPCIQSDIESFIIEIKKLGYLVKLDSNGSMPDILNLLIKKKLVDYIAMDIKAPLEKYSYITRTNINTDKITKSINIIERSGIDHEFRTTTIKSLLPQEDILEIAELIKGTKRYYLQKFTPSKLLDSELKTQKSYSDFDLQKIINAIKGNFLTCSFR